MNPACILRDAEADGVRVHLVDDTPRASGNPEALRRWLPVLRQHKAEVVAELESRARGLARLEVLARELSHPLEFLQCQTPPPIKVMDLPKRGKKYQTAQWISLAKAPGANDTPESGESGEPVATARASNIRQASEGGEPSASRSPDSPSGERDAGRAVTTHSPDSPDSGGVSSGDGEKGVFKYAF